MNESVQLPSKVEVINETAARKWEMHSCRIAAIVDQFQINPDDIQRLSILKDSLAIIFNDSENDCIKTLTKVSQLIDAIYSNKNTL